jgi:hypothetical protein
MKTARHLPNTASLEERFFWSNIPEPNTGCWLWIGGVHKTNKYQVRPTITHRLRAMYAHRVSYMLYKGEIPQGLLVCHRCDNTLCVNPDHLFVGTHQDNMTDCKLKNRISRRSAINQRRLSDHEVAAVRVEHANGASQLSLSRKYCVSPSTIRRAVIHHHYKDVV